MSDLAQYFDEYSRKARLTPALLVALPAAVADVLLWPGLSLTTLLPMVAIAGLPFLLGNLVRDRGKLLEHRLVKHWGGMPTTRMLKLTETTNNPDTLTRRRNRLEQVTGAALPSREQEINHPRRSDERYADATRRLITRVRQAADRHPLVQTENIHYGFRRNMLALKPVAVVVLIVLFVLDVAAFRLHRDPQLVGTATAIHLLALLAWMGLIRDEWVHRQATTYAERLLEALDDPQIHRAETAESA